MKINKYIILLFLILSVESCIKPGVYKNESKGISSNDPVYVRILLSEGTKPFTISSDEGFIIKEKLSSIRKISGNKSLIIKSDELNLPLQILTEKGFIKLNGMPYRGSFEIISSGGRIFAINHLTVEEYLFSVVAGEIPSSWPIEALKAQAVASRTFAYHHVMDIKNKNNIYDLKATTSSQLYKGASSERKETTKAVIDTSGEIMTYNNQIIISFFHSSCGGKTADYKTVWNIKNLEYLHQVECNYCSKSPDFEWEASISMNEIKNKIKKLYKFDGKITGISFEREAGRISEVIIKHEKGIISISGNKFRLLFEPKKIRSLNFVSKKGKSGILLKGRGWGHGVGMCQWGAKGLSVSGYDYRNILKYYFYNIEFSNSNKGIAVK